VTWLAAMAGLIADRRPNASVMLGTHDEFQ
jgi:hypothetical protein